MKKPAAAATVGKHAQHAKPAAVRSGRASAGGKGPKGGGSSKHTPARKHSPAKRKKRGLALGEGVACCSAEALAASLRLAGGTVSDGDVLALYWRAGGDADTGVSVLAALEAASIFGLAGYRPVFEEVMPPDAHRLVLHAVPEPDLSARVTRAGQFLGETYVSDRSPLLLGLELPGPHAVLAEPGRWWSWGEPYDPASFPDAVIEEAWAVSWL